MKVRLVKHKCDGKDLTVEPHFRSLCMSTVNGHDVEVHLREGRQNVKSASSHLQKRGKRLGVGSPSLRVEHDSVYPTEMCELHPTSEETEQQKSHDQHQEFRKQIVLCAQSSHLPTMLH